MTLKINSASTGCVLLAASLSLFLLFCAARANAQQGETIPMSQQQMRNLGIETIQLDPLSTSTQGRFPAQIVLPPTQEFRLSAPDNSQVQKVLVLENQTVAAGEPLVIITSQALGELGLALVENHNRWRLAKQNLNRDQELLNEGIISSRRLNEARAAAQDAQAAFNQTHSALESMGVSQHELKAWIQQGRASDRLTLRAPVAGTVAELVAKPGLRTTADTPLLRLLQHQTLWVDVQVPASQASFWAPGTEFQLNDGTEVRLQSLGATSSIAQTRILRGVIDNPPAHLLPGTYQQTLLPFAKDQGWSLPLDAIVRRGHQAYVFVRQQDGFIATPIELLASGGQRAQVSGPLKAGTEIAASSVVALKAAWLSRLEDQAEAH